jgi:signal transduction histidine kinase
MDYRIYADPDLLKEAVINILNNAVWATKQNTRTREKDIFVAVREWDSGNFVKIIITDTGIGIPADIFAKMFTPFFTMRSDGTGLGLYFARVVIEECQGSIAITKSAPGKGTTVEIKLPISV